MCATSRTHLGPPVRVSRFTFEIEVMLTHAGRAEVVIRNYFDNIL
jgi:hypothetical protein